MTQLPSDYPYHHCLQTRWHDNDVYGHVNNVVYYSYFDTAANYYLIHEAGLDIHSDKIVGFVVASSCQYHAPIAFPQTLDIGLRVNKLGTKSVEYGLAIFIDSAEQTAAVASGTFTHVFVDQASGKSVPIPTTIKTALNAISV